LAGFHAVIIGEKNLLRWDGSWFSAFRLWRDCLSNGKIEKCKDC
jgi:hypothetical protein